jgi:hypothetical protein
MKQNGSARSAKKHANKRNLAFHSFSQLRKEQSVFQLPCFYILQYKLSLLINLILIQCIETSFCFVLIASELQIKKEKKRQTDYFTLYTTANFVVQLS